MVMKGNSKKEEPKRELSKEPEKYPTLKIAREQDIALDFANKVYQKIGKVIKSMILFGSSAKGISAPKSDIDIIIIIDDATIQWDDELIAWYREELGKIIKLNPYAKPLHVNTVRLTTWWNEMMRGEPVVTNIIRWGDPLIDFGGFFAPLKALLAQGKIKSTPEMIFITLGRGPAHMARSKASLLNSIESLYWVFVDSSHAALIAAKQSPPSPEHIAGAMNEFLVKRKLLNPKYVEWYKSMYGLMHGILHQNITTIKGSEIDLWTARADEYLREMANLIKKIT